MCAYSVIVSMWKKIQESNQMLQNSLYTCLLSSNPTKEHLKFVTQFTEGKLVGELSAQDQISSNIQPNCKLLEHIFFLRNVKIGYISCFRSLNGNPAKWISKLRNEPTTRGTSLSASARNRTVVTDKRVWVREKTFPHWSCHKQKIRTRRLVFSIHSREKNARVNNSTSLTR